MVKIKSMKNSNTAKHGIIVKWNDDKGYGFILPESDKREVFFHVSAYSVRGVRPTQGEQVKFTHERDAGGRSRAVFVSPVKPTRQPRTGQACNAVLTSTLFLLVVTALTALNVIPYLLLGLYLGVSLITYRFYAWDKSAAQNNRRRTPEVTLHWLALIGGWPGALIAQQHLRHKSKKRSFRVAYWMTVLLNIAALMYILTPQGNWLIKDINQLLNNLY